jgi:hypothetical protein
MLAAEPLSEWLRNSKPTITFLWSQAGTFTRNGGAVRLVCWVRHPPRRPKYSQRTGVCADCARYSRSIRETLSACTTVPGSDDHHSLIDWQVLFLAQCCGSSSSPRGSKSRPTFLCSLSKAAQRHSTLGRGDAMGLLRAPRPSNATPHQPDEAATPRVGSRRTKLRHVLAWLGDVMLRARNAAGRTQTAAKDHKTDRRLHTESLGRCQSWGWSGSAKGSKALAKLNIGFRLWAFGATKAWP